MEFEPYLAQFRLFYLPQNSACRIIDKMALKAIQTPNSSCNKTAPMPSLDASVCETNSCSKFGNFKIGGFETYFFKVSKADSRECVQYSADSRNLVIIRVIVQRLFY